MATDTATFELHPSQLAAPLDFSALFGRTAPLVVEVGCGGGRTLIGMALARPERNYLGIECAGDYYKVLLARVAKRALPNMRVSRADAAYLVQRYFGGKSVQEYHIYFPDPWPKKRHRKRRLFSAQFCADLQRTLAGDGILYAASDFQEYYEELRTALQAVFAVQEHPQPWEDAPLGRTNYEVKYIQEGRPIYRLVARAR